MFSGPDKLFVDCRCPSCHKLFSGTINASDKPRLDGRRYAMLCWACMRIGKPKWVQEWIDNQQKTNGE